MSVTVKMESMKSHEKLMKTYEELCAWREKLKRDVVPADDKYDLILSAFNSLAASVAQSLNDASRCVKKISEETDSYKPTAGYSLYVGKSSVQPLIELKQTADDILSNVEESGNKEFREEINYDVLYQELETFQDKREGYQNEMKRTLEGMMAIFDGLNSKEDCKSHDSEVSAPLGEETGSSSSDFSLLQFSTTAPVTSSPIPNNCS